jgi:hypothetical protein
MVSPAPEGIAAKLAINPERAERKCCTAAKIVGKIEDDNYRQ